MSVGYCVDYAIFRISAIYMDSAHANSHRINIFCLKIIKGNYFKMVYYYYGDSGCN